MFCRIAIKSTPSAKSWGMTGDGARGIEDRLALDLVARHNSGYLFVGGAPAQLLGAVDEEIPGEKDD
jgi:hypothetical protein